MSATPHLAGRAQPTLPRPQGVRCLPAFTLVTRGGGDQAFKVHVRRPSEPHGESRFLVGKRGFGVRLKLVIFLHSFGRELSPGSHSTRSFCPKASSHVHPCTRARTASRVLTHTHGDNRPHTETHTPPGWTVHMCSCRDTHVHTLPHVPTCARTLTHTLAPPPQPNVCVPLGTGISAPGPGLLQTVEAVFLSPAQLPAVISRYPQRCPKLNLSSSPNLLLLVLLVSGNGTPSAQVQRPSLLSPIATHIMCVDPSKGPGRLLPSSPRWPQGALRPRSPHTPSSLRSQNNLRWPPGHREQNPSLLLSLLAV